MIKISGHSDDLIEVEGDVREEFTHLDSAPAILGLSDGTLVRVHRDDEGVWRVVPIVRASPVEHTLGEEDGTDVLTIDASIGWVVYTTGGRDDRLVYAITSPKP